MISDTGSDPTVGGHGLQQELTTAADTFQLDCLDDIDNQFPSYEPDYLQYVWVGPPSLVYDNMPAHLTCTRSTPIPAAAAHNAPAVTTDDFFGFSF
jgi:hypothetical protein